MTRRAVIAATTGAAALAVTVVVAVTATGALPAFRSTPIPSPGASSSVAPGTSAASTVGQARAFLDDWTDGGRVVRRDQGGDTVSEGQAYGLLAAVVADDEKRFDAIWSWTRDHLQRDDGLLAWRWASGSVVDDQPASDADLDAARALVVAGSRFDRPDLRTAGVGLGDVILDRLTVTTAAGRILLPGLWATATQPYAYNPSYASPAAFDVLHRATGDPRWTQLNAGTSSVTAALLDKSPLPPDWAQVHQDGAVDAMPGAQGRGGAVAFGYDAGRLPIRFAESCTAADRSLAARLLAPLDRAAVPAAVVDLGGTPMTTDSSPLAYASRAAAASASDRTAATAHDLRSARRFSDEHPTYYGRAWSALGAAMLTSDVLGGCATTATGAGS